MPSMSYCLFQNTSGDLADCLEKLEAAGWDVDSMDKSDEEKKAARELITMCHRVAAHTEDPEEED